MDITRQKGAPSWLQLVVLNFKPEKIAQLFTSTFSSLPFNPTSNNTGALSTYWGVWGLSLPPQPPVVTQKLQVMSPFWSLFTAKILAYNLGGGSSVSPDSGSLMSSVIDMLGRFQLLCHVHCYPSSSRKFLSISIDKLILGSSSNPLRGLVSAISGSRLKNRGVQFQLLSCSFAWGLFSYQSPGPAPYPFSSSNKLKLFKNELQSSHCHFLAPSLFVPSFSCQGSFCGCYCYWGFPIICWVQFVGGKLRGRGFAVAAAGGRRLVAVIATRGGLF
ncbi:hypothetical protein FGO68_gene12257 [Halteria grandinella]|uniref:Uncharacterized protein n=1 Tax=Halteria grandinella TaxID=5974 RepID=A0A8J8SWP6_HALGN|nr:hypothetical protein FGO68_gene12257 [Halteria grandinella]